MRAHCAICRPTQEIVITPSFQTLGLSAKLLRAIDEQGFTTPTPIQAQAIPIMLTGSDLLATAQTGTGKTAGFVLPILDRLAIAPKQKGARKRIRALILTPTRELAAQVEQNIRSLGAYAGFVSTTVYGGVSIRNQITALHKGVDILVATPGRLLDHVQQRTVDLGGVEIFVLDEADRMLDMGFAPDVRRIASLLSSERQTAMFSATFSRETRALANATLRSPKTVEVGRTDRPIDLVEQEVHLVSQEHKSSLLRHLIQSQSLHQVLVFTRTKHGADRLATHLERSGIEADAIHGDKRQAQRQKALDRFKSGALQALVATDVAARGIDISGLPAVVNYDIPNTPEAYVHRIGRTGRAGAKGRAISLVMPADRAAIADIERHLQCRIERRNADGFVYAPREALEEADVASAPATPRRGQQERPRRDAARPSSGDSRGSRQPARPGKAPARGKASAHSKAPAYGKAAAHEARPARGGPHAAAAAPRAPRPQQDDERRAGKARPVRARHAEDPAARGERSPKRNVGGVFRPRSEGDASSGTSERGGKRKGLMGAIARFLNN